MPNRYVIRTWQKDHTWIAAVDIAGDDEATSEASTELGAIIAAVVAARIPDLPPQESANG